MSQYLRGQRSLSALMLRHHIGQHVAMSEGSEIVVEVVQASGQFGWDFLFRSVLNLHAVWKLMRCCPCCQGFRQCDVKIRLA